MFGKVRRGIDKTADLDAANDPVQVSVARLTQMRQHVQGANARCFAPVFHAQVPTELALMVSSPNAGS